MFLLSIVDFWDPCFLLRASGLVISRKMIFKKPFYTPWVVRKRIMSFCGAKASRFKEKYKMRMMIKRSLMAKINQHFIY